MLGSRLANRGRKQERQKKRKKLSGISPGSRSRCTEHRSSADAGPALGCRLRLRSAQVSLESFIFFIVFSSGVVRGSPTFFYLSSQVRLFFSFQHMEIRIKSAMISASRPIAFTLHNITLRRLWSSRRATHGEAER